MNAKSLISALSPALASPVGDTVWMCSACRTAWATESNADACCSQRPCVRCDEIAVNTLSMCEKCLVRDRTVLEAQLFQAADKIGYDAYDGMFLFWNGAGPDGDFFSSRTELEEHCFKLGVLPPKWVWACEGVGFLLDAEDLLTNSSDRSGHAFRDRLEQEDVDELQDLLDSWAMKQGVKTYDVDYTRAVVLDDEMNRKLRARNSQKAPAIEEESDETGDQDLN